MVAQGVTARAGRTGARDESLPAPRRDGRGKAVPVPVAAGDGQPVMIPALLRSYGDLGAIRHDFPVVLLQGGRGATVAPLADLLDGLLHQLDPSASDVEGLRRDLYRLETRIKRLADAQPGALLSTLWSQATAELLEDTGSEERREALGPELETARQAIGRDGTVVPCRSDAARLLVEHAWHRLRSEQATRDAEVLDDLISRVSDVIDAERARAPESASPAALRASMGDAHSGIDFEALSELLHTAGRHERTAGARARRLREPLQAIEAERDRLLGEAASHVAPGGLPAVAAYESCAAALGAWRSEMERQTELLGAIRLATLELENRFRADRHDALFRGPDTEQLTPEARRALPPLLVCLDADRLAPGDWSALLGILASDMPLKILLAVHETPGAPLARREGTATWPGRLAEMAMLLGEAFVVQTAASHLPRLAESVTAALRHEGPALLSVFVGPSSPAAGIPTYVHCAAAVESRAVPSFVYDPDRGPDWPDRFALVGSPQAELAWPRHRVAYEDPDGGSVEEELAFTVVDLLVLDPRLRRHFGLVPRAGWHPRMLPVAEYLALPAKAAADSLAYVYLVDAADRLHRAVIGRDLLAIARSCATHWAKLQGLARPTTALVGAAPPVAPEAPSEPTTAAPEPTTAAPEPTPSPDAAWIDTALCTTCDECTALNPRMFAYNEAKQAFIRDVRAGTYRELVEAAETCPVCIIHPGKPLDPNEPGLDELIARAASFSR